MKNRKSANKSRKIVELRRESRRRRRALRDSSSRKALQFEEDDSFEEAFELNADDLALADTERGEALRGFHS
jgi:hypothetical protein